MKQIVIIGAGYSGAVVAARLLHAAPPHSVQITLLNGSGHIARGMAYGTQSPEHALNVPAGNMSAYEEDPDHFLNFVKKIDSAVNSGTFISRRVYGEYLEWMLNQAEQAAKPGNTLRRVYEQVVAVQPAKELASHQVKLESGGSLVADKIVLALGHFPSHHPRVEDPAFYSSERYLRDPWDQTRLTAIPAAAPVLLIGSGLTAVDVAMTLLRDNPDRPIVAVSRRGLRPQYHRMVAVKPHDTDMSALWGDATTVRKQLRGFRDYCTKLALQGRDWREGLAILRPATADVWRTYSAQERRRFLRHVQPFWDTHRHRLAPAIAERFEAALGSGNVRLLAARIQGYNENSCGVEVALRPRGTTTTTTISVQHVINCTGPCSDPRQVESPLIQQLMHEGLMRPDELGLGIDVGADCALLNADGRPSTNLFYIGPWLKAGYWEATAVPDLRRFARIVTRQLLSDHSGAGETAVHSGASIANCSTFR
jgi:uncharacterized NAD(P)/FAD-binding protein YdhS